MLIKKLSNLTCFLLFILFTIQGFSQYSISGYLDYPEKNKKVYLSILRFNELNTIGKDQILTITKTDSTGYFNFEGQLLSEKHALYRIHVQLDEQFEGTHMIYNEKLKNFHNFIFSNTDTIVFQKNSHHWFGSNINTNSVDKQWNKFGKFSEKLGQEFSTISSPKVVKESGSRFLWELKTFIQKEELHPLAILILLSELPYEVLKEDVDSDPKFYSEIQRKLELYYDGTGYAQQFKDLLLDFSKNETQEELDLYKQLTVAFGGSAVLLGVLSLLFFLKFRRLKKHNFKKLNVNFTSQEERVAELIVEDKSNKEIANELFISLNTVKTHVRNLYGKLEVSNRRDFIEKFKNHPRD